MNAIVVLSSLKYALEHASYKTRSILLDRKNI